VDSDLQGKYLPVIQLAITPVILLSGVGALMITLTNRLGRVVDRTRGLAGQMKPAAGVSTGTTPPLTGGPRVSPEIRAHLENQLDILWRRAKLLRLAVTLAGISMLLSCLLVTVIFVDATFQRDFGLEVVVIFAASIVSLILALVAFLRDLWMSLWALHAELNRARQS
jgi:hypothetical protein